MNTNERLRELTEQYSLTRVEIAKHTQTKRRGVENWFQNRRKIPAYKLRLLEEALKCTIAT